MRDDFLDEDGRTLTLDRVLRSIQSAARYNGLDEIITGWAKLKAKDGIIEHHDYNNHDYPEWARNQLQVYWMICVLMFGDYCTSPRFGWITRAAAPSFRKFCEEFSEYT